MAQAKTSASLVNHFLERSASRLPKKTAVVHNGQEFSYAEVNAKANVVANWLFECGIGKGARVVLMAENGLDYIAGYYGTLKAGGVAAPLNPDIKAATLAPIIAELTPKAILASRRAEAELHAIVPDEFNGLKLLIKGPRLKWGSSDYVHSWDESLASYCDAPCVEMTSSDLASIIYTSGSTGKPKGVMLTHNNIATNTHSICACLHIGTDDIQMVVLPFYYVMGKSLLNTHFAAGATVVINNNFAYPASVVKQLVDENVTSFSGVPSTFAHLLHRSPLKKYREQLTSLRYCSQAGGHMSQQTKLDLRAALPDHTDIFIMYGATEASARLACLQPEMFSVKLGSIGKPVAGVSIQVLDREGQEVSAGEVGELVASGANIMAGYWKDSESTAKVLDASGYHTGDLGYQDDEGFLYITGRKDNLIKVGGHRINPQEVEDAIIATSMVIDCAVVGVNDTLLGKRLEALVVMKEKSSTTAELAAACTKYLPKHQIPGRIVTVHALPLNGSGKIDRAQCLAVLSDISIVEERPSIVHR